MTIKPEIRESVVKLLKEGNLTNIQISDTLRVSLPIVNNLSRIYCRPKKDVVERHSNHIFKNVMEAAFYGKENEFTPKPCKPTKAKPGSPEKVEVLAARAAAGEELWSDKDPNCFADAMDLVTARTDSGSREIPVGDWHRRKKLPDNPK